MGENIGAVARAMANFGFSELRIVEPRDGWPNAQAEAMATNALPILQAATIFPDVPSAMHDITRAYATTARPRELEKRVVTPEAAMQEMTGKVALMFGPERTGLTNEDLSWADTIITIPTTENSSLNIAQSMVVLGYEWYVSLSRAQSRDLTLRDGDPSTSPRYAQDELQAATIAEYDQLFRKLETYLDASDFFKVQEKKPGMWMNIRTMLLRGRHTSQEIRTLHGIIRALAEKK